MAGRIHPVDITGKKILDLKAWKSDINNFNKEYFDSNFERKCCLLLRQENFNVDFHPPARELMESFQTFALSRSKAGVKLFKSTVRSISYTPDFLIRCNDGTDIYIEAKGFFRDGARMRYKLFQKTLKSNEYIFLVPDTPNEGINTLKAIIQIIKEKFGGSTKELKRENIKKVNKINI